MFAFPQQQQHQHVVVNAAEEKLSALKRVYAEILFNTTKESAARILASENKALGFQKSLVAIKEEAVQTLVRLKGIMDNRVSQAEHVSSSQLSRIKELETQLNESENTIKNLKMELEKRNVELQKIKEISIKESDKHSAEVVSNQKEPLEENELIVQDSLPSLSGSDGGCNTISKNYSQPDNLHQLSLKNYFASSDISSMMVGKGPEFLRKGRTQRIRASEQNYVASGKMDDKSSKSPSSDSRNDMNQNPYSIKHDSPVTCSKPPDGSIEVAGEYGKSQDDMSVRFSRRLSSRNCRSKYATHKDSFYVDLQTYKSSSQRSTKKDQLSDPSPSLMKCENDEKRDESSFQDVERNALSHCKKLVELAEGSDCKPAIEEVHVSPVKSNLKACETNGNLHTIGGQIVKYTFQRKRLKRPSSANEDISSEIGENNNKRKLSDMTSCTAEAKSISLALESPTESHRIARQLISLSGKR